MAYEPTHHVPASGLPAFVEPDATPGAAAQLVPGLDVQVLERRDDWAHIECSNGWQAWVNGTLLVEREAAPPPPPASGPTAAPPTPEPSSEPLLAGPAPAPAPSAAPVDAPSGAWNAPSAGAAAAGTGGAGIALGPGPVVAAIGGLAFAISGWLNWLGSIEGSESASAYDAPARFLIDVDADLGGPSLGIFVLIVGIIVIVGAVVRGLGLLSLIGGVVAFLIVVLFTFQLNRLVDDLNDLPGIDVSLSDFLDFGEYVAVIGAILSIVGGALSLRRV